MVDITCCNCGEVFGLSAQRYAALRASRATFHCSHGHPQHFLKQPTEEQKQIAVLQRENGDLKRWLGDAREKAALFKCPVAYCSFAHKQKTALRYHLLGTHGWREQSKALPANAGPDAHDQGS